MAWFINRLKEHTLLTATEVYENVGFKNIVGVSFNGKKALAGPVCAAAVIIEPHLKIQYVELAKNLSESECAKVSSDIKLRANFVSLGWGVPEDYERGSDYPLLKALSACLAEFSAYKPVTAIVIDGFGYTEETLPTNLNGSQIPIIRLDGASDFFEPNVAAAIVAKAARNALMSTIHAEFPVYGWNTNKGFATPQHLEAIKTNGWSGHHRSQQNKDI
jgi:ribonuclease HII